MIGDAPAGAAPAVQRAEYSTVATLVPRVAAASVLILLVGLLFATQLRQRHIRWLAPVLLLALLVANAACGGGGSTTTPTNPGTPMVQNQPVTVTVTSGAITHTFTFTLTVN